MKIHDLHLEEKIPTPPIEVRVFFDHVHVLTILHGTSRNGLFYLLLKWVV